MEASSLANLLIEEARFRLVEESIPRLRKCLEKMTPEQIWYRPNKETVSAGNLVLHLCGNVKQWLISGLGGLPDHRNRSLEFEEEGPLETGQLFDMLADLESQINAVMDKMPLVDLSAHHSIQGFTVSGVSILIHVVEHFSYHVGQVTFMVKSRQALDMGYYQGLDLEQKND